MVMKTNCTGMESNLADLLLDPERVPAEVSAHVEACEHCRAEFKELQATMALLDTWKGPEPSPYFLSRLDARMREQREAEPASRPADGLLACAAAFCMGRTPTFVRWQPWRLQLCFLLAAGPI